MGAMSPVSIPATLVQQMAEALSGIALTQLVQPGCPVVFGSFLSNTDMKSGSPSFGTPESAIGLLCTGQIARHFDLPWRSGGGLTSSQTPDAQAAYEALMTMLPTFLAGANFVMHAAGWLEGGLVSSYEKYIVDIEILRMLKHEFKPLEVDEDTLAFGAHEEVGSGGHFLGAAHTLEHFRDLLLPAAPLLDRELRPLVEERRRRRRRARRADRAGDARRLRAAADRRRGARPAARLRRPPPHRARRRADSLSQLLIYHCSMDSQAASSSLPAQAKCVVIGAGIVGNCLVGHLARLGWKDLVLIDKGPLPNPGGSTGHASNFIFPVDHSREMTDAHRRQPRASTRSSACSPTCGGIEVARTEERMEELRRRMASAKALGRRGLLARHAGRDQGARAVHRRERSCSAASTRRASAWSTRCAPAR